MSSAGPDFLCIGAPKAGTTWLYLQLSRHPDVWMPVVKELHYFDGCHPVPRVGGFQQTADGLFGLHRDHPRRQIILAYARALRRGRPSELNWVWRFFTGQRDDDWYLRLFPGRRVRGELTTDYCALDDDGVAHVRKLCPEVRVIFLMRDPVSRAFSHARMVLPRLHGKPLEALEESDFDAYLRNPAARRRGDYPATIRLWERHFPSQQLLFSFYDRVADDPAGLYRDVQQFLGLAPRTESGSELDRRVNVAAPSRFDRASEQLLRMLAGLYLPDLEWLADRYPDPASRWLDKARVLLDGAAP
jgi:hypothetical protein